MKKGINLLFASTVVLIVLLAVVGILSYNPTPITTPGGNILKSAELSDTQKTCVELCQKTDSLTLAVQWKPSEYCEFIHEVDDEVLHCWNEPVNVNCQATLKFGRYPITCTQAKCLRGC